MASFMTYLLCLPIVVHFVNTNPIFSDEQMKYLESMKMEIDSLKKEVEQSKQAVSACLGHKTPRLLLGPAEPVAFYARLSTNMNINSQQAIPYDIVVTNTGNAYDLLTGQFKAPGPGLYHFTNTVMSQPNHGIHVDIVKNGIVVGKNWADHNGYESGSVSVIVELEAGDRVWVRDADVGSEHLEHDYNSFSGFLIY